MMGSTLNFLNQQQPIPGLAANVGDFWQWAYSDIMSNGNRSVFAEYMVGVALDVVGTPRIEWDSTDLHYLGFEIEVKASAYCQSWHQEKPSIIRFGIGKAVFWNRATSKYEGDARRCADLYIFCHHSELDKAKANILDVAAWDFYVVSTGKLNSGFADVKSLSLKTVRKIGERCKFDQLKATVDRVLNPSASVDPCDATEGLTLLLTALETSTGIVDPKVGSSAKWDRDSFLDALHERAGSEAVGVATGILEWATGPQVSWGKGKKDGGCVVSAIYEGVEYKLFEMWTYGRIEILFQHLSVPTELTEGLASRLNTIPGVVIPPDALARRPAFDMSLLKDRAHLSNFFEAIEWFAQQIETIPTLLR